MQAKSSKEENKVGSQFKDLNKIVVPLLNIYDEIRNDIGHNEDIKIPTVVVIGDQSHGKSSLMESISGVDLPRKANICTRVPCELQLRSCDEKHDEPCIEISAKHDELQKPKRIPQNEISKYVEDYTKTLVNGNDTAEAVADKPITLRIYDQDLPNLTLVDLPGLIHNDDNDDKIQVIF